MDSERRWTAGIDWAAEEHEARLVGPDGEDLGRRRFKHSAAGLSALADWLVAAAGAPASMIDVAIETPHGPVCESLMERGFAVHAINPKQADRFRDRYSMSGAKDDTRDRLVLASALRTDPQCFRKIAPVGRALVALREWSRQLEELAAERVRLGNRMRALLWRYYPAFLELGGDLCGAFALALWQAAPSPAKARGMRQATAEALLKRFRIRRFTGESLRALLGQPDLGLQPGTLEAVVGHIGMLVPRLKLLNRQIAEAGSRLDALTAEIGAAQTRARTAAPGPQAADPRTPELRAEPGARPSDAAILASLPGVGRGVVATLLAEAHDAVARRDHAALRALAGVAPVTRRSGKAIAVVRRNACHVRVANAMHYWAQTAVNFDPASKAKYAALRQRGHKHARSLRSVADRLLNVACAMLKTGTLYDPAKAARKTAC
jgi:transposase